MSFTTIILKSDLKMISDQFTVPKVVIKLESYYLVLVNLMNFPYMMLTGSSDY